jgi:hypothetical protein
MRKPHTLKRCPAKTKFHYRCGNAVIAGSDYCWVHSAQQLMRQEFTQYRLPEPMVRKVMRG